MYPIQIFAEPGFAEKLKSWMKKKKLFYKSKPCISDVTEAARFQELKTKWQLDLWYNLVLSIYSDGATIMESSKKTMWPIFIHILNLPPFLRRKFKYTIIGGLWLHKSQPHMPTFLEPVVEDLRLLSTVGIDVTFEDYKPPQKPKAHLLMVLGDNPAKCKMIGSWWYLDGNGGCNCCNIRPERGKTKRKQTFASKDYRQFANQAELESDTGLKFLSAFSVLEDFDVVLSAPFEVMHTAWLCVANHFLKLWLDTKTEKYSLAPEAKVVFEARMKNLKVTHQFSRIPRGWDEGKWKAVELKNFCLYFFPVIMADLLPSQYFLHFMKFVDAMRWLDSERLTAETIEDAEVQLKQFVEQIPALYQVDEMDFTVHAIVHLPFYCSLYGPLFTCSVFEEEGLMKTVSENFHGTTKYFEQFTRVATSMKYVEKLEEEVSSVVHPKLKMLLSHLRSKLVSDGDDPKPYKQVTVFEGVPASLAAAKFYDKVTLKCDGREMQYCTKARAEQFRSDSSWVLVKNGTRHQLGRIHYIAVRNNHIVTVGIQPVHTVPFARDSVLPKNG
jgi:hypothetical protein